MKVSPILSIFALTAPIASATTPQRKRVFKIYTPTQIREFEETYDERMLKKTQEPTMSMTMAPTAATETGSPTPAPQAITEAPQAATEAPQAATDAPVAATGAPTPLLGSSYCTYAPDETCYEGGWPKCCGKKDGKDCPEEQPPCEIETEEPTPAPIGATDAPTVAATDAPVAATVTDAPVAVTEDIGSMSMATNPPVVVDPTDPPVVPVPTNPPIEWTVETSAPTKASPSGSFTFPPSPSPVENIETPENPFATQPAPAGSGAMALGTSLAAVAVAGAMMLL